MQVHGGEGKDSNTLYDFSVNINPFGMPKTVADAWRSLLSGTSAAEVYPDRTCREVREAAAGHYGVPQEWIACGCGASELIYKIAAAYRGKRVLLAAPCFGEYEKALREADCAISFVNLREEHDFAFDEDFWQRFLNAAVGGRREITGGGSMPEAAAGESRRTDLVFFCTPNNPTAGRIPQEQLNRIVRICMRHGIRVVVDECFLPFVTGEEPTIDFLRSGGQGAGSPVVLKALTKSHAIPGIRLGLAISPDTEWMCALREKGAPWTVSGIAAKLGQAAFEQWDEIPFRNMRRVLAAERSFLEDGLRNAGAKVYPGEGNFILFRPKTENSLFLHMRACGILIRDCESFRGLGKGYYRIAVRTHRENEVFLNALQSYVDRGYGT